MTNKSSVSHSKYVMNGGSEI